jgi:uncharacterized protein involved in exopolysaccharide biosynthesis/Mrp family chromosome partitioning ATPase
MAFELAVKSVILHCGKVAAYEVNGHARRKLPLGWTRRAARFGEGAVRELRLAMPPSYDRQPAPPFAPIRLQRFAAVLTDHWRLIGGTLLAFLALAAIYVAFTPTSYSATATVTLEQRQREVVEGAQVLSDLPVSLGGVADTEVEVLRSRAVALGAAERLGLSKAQELVGPQAPADAAATFAAAADRISESILVVRLGMSFAISVTAHAPAPALAADIANAVVESYLSLQLREKNSATDDAARYLGSQIEQLRGEVREAEQAVSNYQAANHLLAASGSELTEQRMSEFQRQEADAQAIYSEKAARLAAARAQLSDGKIRDGSIGEGQNSAVIHDLRSKLADVIQQQSDAAVRYGPKHPKVKLLQEQRDALEGALRLESRRIIEGLESDAAAAEGRLASVTTTVAAARSTLGRENSAAVPLAELTREADAKRSLYKTYLARYQQLMSVRGQAASDARLASSATPPTTPEAPRPTMAFVLAIIVGGGLGIVLAVIAEIIEHRVRSRADIEDRLHAQYLGFTPRVDARRYGATTTLIDQQPNSQFSEAFRTLRLLLNNQGARKPRVIAVTSAMSDEGKTSTALAIARSTARSGRTALLIDCDSRRQGLGRSLARVPVAGMAEVIEGATTLEEAIVHDPGTGCDVIAACAAGRIVEEDLENEAVAGVVSSLRPRYDLIILDCGPLLAVAEAQARVTIADYVVLLARWRKTPMAALKEALSFLDQQKIANVGVVITMIPPGVSEAGNVSYYYKRLAHQQAA